MSGIQQVSSQIGRPAPRPSEAAIGDIRFRSLLTFEDWSRLPGPVQRRFSKRMAEGATSIYVGRIVETDMTRLGWLIAQALRVIGGPLPIGRDVDVPSVVSVTEDFARGGQVWTRLYARRSGFPQMVHSAKRFQGPTGLEEYVGFGLGMALAVGVEDGALTFRSAFCFLGFGRWRLKLPVWATPGHITVTHKEIDEASFRFTLVVSHPWAGRLLRKVGIYREARE
jgi:hypothetical protein